MDVSSVAPALQAASGGSEIGVAVLKKAQDAMEGQSNKLLESLPNPPGMGKNFDASA